MTMKGHVIIGTFLFLLIACSKTVEPDPAPQPKANLYVHFSGNFNGVPIELTENVVGFYHVASDDKELNLPPDYSSVIYHSQMKSDQTLTSIRLGRGAIFWDGSLTEEPSLASFNHFFQNTLFPDYSNDAVQGFDVRYRDDTGRIWTSDASSTYPQNVEFTNIHLTSDANGDYAGFTCYFDCYVYSLNPDSLALQINHLDSVHITNATYDGWFER